MVFVIYILDRRNKMIPNCIFKMFSTKMPNTSLHTHTPSLSNSAKIHSRTPTARQSYWKQSISKMRLWSRHHKIGPSTSWQSLLMTTDRKSRRIRWILAYLTGVIERFNLSKAKKLWLYQPESTLEKHHRATLSMDSWNSCSLTMPELITFEKILFLNLSQCWIQME